MATEVGVLSVDELLARAKAAAASKSSIKGQSTIQKMIAEMEGKVDQDSINLSPVAKLLKQQSAAKAQKPTAYTEQEWYINAKVSQLKGQIQLYSTLPGLDPGGSIMDSLTDEVNALVSSQQAKLKESTDAAAKKQAELDTLEAEKAAAPMTADEMLKRASNKSNGIETPAAISKEVQALLDKVKGKVVNTTA